MQDIQDVSVGHENVKPSGTNDTCPADESNEPCVTETQEEDTALNKNVLNDLQGTQKSEDSSLSNISQHIDSKVVDEGAKTDNKCLSVSGEGDSKSENSIPEEVRLTAEQGSGSGLSSEKKTEHLETKTDASHIIADVVESIEQESAPPVAPPRRKRKKKKSAVDTQVRITKIKIKRLNHVGDNGVTLNERK